MAARALAIVVMLWLGACISRPTGSDLSDAETLIWEQRTAGSGITPGLTRLEIIEGETGLDEWGRTVPVLRFLLLSHSKGEGARPTHTFDFELASGRFIAETNLTDGTRTFWRESGYGTFPPGERTALFLFLIINQMAGEGATARVAGFEYRLTPSNLDFRRNDCSAREFASNPPFGVGVSFHVCLGTGPFPVREVASLGPVQESRIRLVAAPREIPYVGRGDAPEPVAFNLLPWDVLSAPGVSIRSPVEAPQPEPSDLRRFIEAVLRNPSFVTNAIGQDGYYLMGASWSWSHQVLGIGDPAFKDSPFLSAHIEVGTGQTWRGFWIQHTSGSSSLPQAAVSYGIGSEFARARPTLSSLPSKLVPLSEIQSHYAMLLPNASQGDPPVLPERGWGFPPDASGVAQLQWNIRENCAEAEGGKFVAKEGRRFWAFSAVNGQILKTGPVKPTNSATLMGCSYGWGAGIA